MNLVNKINLLKINQDLALLLTATIDIKGMPKAYPTVAEQREEDYFNSLTYYLTNQPLIRKIIFVENSGWPLDRVKESLNNNPHNKEVEFISLNSNDFPRKFGKGYGESLLIEQGIAESTLVKTVTYIAKITGRIYLTNMTQILERIKEPYDCLCDLKEQLWRIRRLWGEAAVPYADTRFLVFTKPFYEKYFQPMHNRHQEGCFYSEHRFYEAIKTAQATEKIIDRFPIEPKFRGIAGHFQGKNYDNPREQVKFIIRSTTRKIAPWLYF